MQQTLLDEIVVYSNYTYCDSIGFSNNLLNDVDKLYRLFDVLQDGISQELTHEDFHHYQKDDSEALFYDSSEEGTIYRGLGLWIADVLSRHISLNYMRSQETRGKADELRNRFKEYTKEWQIVQS